MKFMFFELFTACKKWNSCFFKLFSLQKIKFMFFEAFLACKWFRGRLYFDERNQRRRWRFLNQMYIYWNKRKNMSQRSATVFTILTCVTHVLKFWSRFCTKRGNYGSFAGWGQWMWRKSHTKYLNMKMLTWKYSNRLHIWVWKW